MLNDIDRKVLKQSLIGKAFNMCRSSFQQEAAYVNAFLGSLSGTEIRLKDSDLSIKLNATIINDRGPNSAESKFGADFSITFSDGATTKSVLFQAKNRKIDELSASEQKSLSDQCGLMHQQTIFWGVVECPSESGASPTVLDMTTLQVVGLGQHSKITFLMNS